MTPHETIILTLRASGESLGDPGVQSAIRRQVATSAISPSVLPPSAILIVRRMTDPRPGAIGTDPSRTVAPPSWCEGAGRRLDELFRCAWRPGREPVPGHASAVVFDDESELLACLSLDIARGTAHREWWWRHRRSLLHPNIRAGRQIADLLLETPRHVPHILRYLRYRNADGHVLGQLTRLEVAASLHAMCHAWGLPELVPPGVDMARDVLERQPASPDIPSSDPSTSGTIGLDVRVPTEHRALVWLADLLTTSSVEALRRRSEFLSWWSITTGQSGENSFRLPREPSFDTTSEVPTTSSPMGSSPPTLDRWPANGPSIPGAVEARTDGPDASQDPIDVGVTKSATSSSGPHRPPRTEIPPQYPDRTARPSAGKAGQPQEGPARPRVTPILARSSGEGVTFDERAPDGPSPDPAPMVTSVGGVFFLMGAIERLRSSADPAQWQTITGWQALEAVGATLAAESAIGESDDLWPWLASLARPSGEAFGEGLGEAQAPGVVSVDSRCIVDTPIPVTPEGSAWIRRVVPSVRRWLASALMAPNEHTAVSRLLPRKATVYQTTSHVDVTFPLESASIEVRRAGLDRDPGWVPWYGRVITFYYK